MTAQGTVTATPPLLISGDSRVVEAGQRWCAAVGVTAFTTDDAATAYGKWRQAPFILIGHDYAEELSQLRPSKRASVHIVCIDPEPCWRPAVELGAETVVPVDDDGFSEKLIAAAEGRNEACVIAVIGGSGGVGASTLVSGMALEASRRGLGTLTVDGDPYGAGIDTVFGCESSSGVRWPELVHTHGRISGSALKSGLISHRGISVLSASRDIVEPVDAPALESVVQASMRHFDLVILDIPRAAAPSLQHVFALCAVTLFVVPEEIRAIAAARSVFTSLGSVSATPVLVTRARRGGVGAEESAQLMGIPRLGRIRQDRRLPGMVDHGQGPGRSRTVRRAAGRVLDGLGLKSDRPRSRPLATRTTSTHTGRATRAV